MCAAACHVQLRSIARNRFSSLELRVSVALECRRCQAFRSGLRLACSRWQLPPPEIAPGRSRPCLRSLLSSWSNRFQPPSFQRQRRSVLPPTSHVRHIVLVAIVAASGLAVGCDRGRNTVRLASSWRRTCCLRFAGRNRWGSDARRWPKRGAPDATCSRESGRCAHGSYQSPGFR